MNEFESEHMSKDDKKIKIKCNLHIANAGYLKFISIVTIMLNTRG